MSEPEARDIDRAAADAALQAEWAYRRSAEHGGVDSSESRRVAAEAIAVVLRPEREAAAARIAELEAALAAARDRASALEFDANSAVGLTAALTVLGERHAALVEAARPVLEDIAEEIAQFGEPDTEGQCEAREALDGSTQALHKALLAAEPAVTPEEGGKKNV